jgi:hypothetical protein
MGLTLAQIASITQGISVPQANGEVPYMGKYY